MGQRFIRRYGGSTVEVGFGNSGAQHVEPIQRRLAGDRPLVAFKTKGRVLDGELEVLGHLAPAQHASNTQADLVAALQWLARPRHRRLNTRQIFLSSGQQRFAFARPFAGQGTVS